MCFKHYYLVIFLFLTTSAFGVGVEGCYEFTTDKGEVASFKLSHVYSNKDVGSIYHMEMKLSGVEILNKDLLWHYNVPNCNISTPNMKIGTNKYIFIYFEVSTLNGLPISMIDCNLTTFDIHKQIATIDRNILYMDVSTNNDYPSERLDRGYIFNPKPVPCNK